MLRAILGNKSGRITLGDASVSVREVYKDREDMLTAAIISRASYLSDISLYNIFSSIFTDSSNDFSLLTEVEFWPNFTSSIQQRVEPDVILHFDWGIMVIEAKRPHDSHQYAEQWIKELESLPLSYRERDIYFLSLGGSSANNIKELRRFEPLRCSYKDISIPQPNLMTYQTWEGLINYLQITRDTGDLSRSDYNIISDMIKALELYHVHANVHSLLSLKPLDIKTSSLPVIFPSENVPLSVSEHAKSSTFLAELPVQHLNWPASATSLYRIKTNKPTWQIKPLCNINERALKLWKI